MRGVWLLLLLTGCCSAQQGSYTLAGTVVNARTGEPVKRALVTAFPIKTRRDAGADAPAQGRGLYTSTSSVWSVAALTDVSGVFRFTGLTAGMYNLSAQKPQFTEPAAQRVPVRLDSASKEDVRLDLSPLGTIDVSITNQRGEPVSGAKVVTMRTRIIDGRREISVFDTDSTDDRGVVRVWNLEPGRYLIKVAAAAGSTIMSLGDAGRSTDSTYDGFQATYFGGPSADSASTLVVEPGTEGRADISVVLQPAYKVRGRLSNLKGGQTDFTLLSGEEETGHGRVALSFNSGAFEMIDVVNGSYTLRVTQGDSAIAEVPVTVDGGDVNGLQMSLEGPVEIPVSVRIIDQPEVRQSPGNREGQLGQAQRILPNPGFCWVALHGVVSTPTGGGRRADAPVSVLPGRYRVGVLCGNAYVVSASMGSTDLLTNPWITVLPGTAPAPIEIVARRGGGAIAGAIKIDQEVAAGALWVLALPRVSTRDPEFAEAIAGNRQFAFQSLAPGDYLLYAFPTDQVEYHNPEFLRRLTGGESVHVEEGAPAIATITSLAQ